MGRCRLIRAADRRWEHVAGPPGEIRAARDVHAGNASSMGCGLVTLEDTAIEWTVQYDEYFYGLDGVLDIETRDGTHRIQPGDGLWIPDGTPLVYRSRGAATCAFAIWPGDWRDRPWDGMGKPRRPCRLVRPVERVFKPLEVPSPGLLIARDADGSISESMVAGLCTFEDCRIPWRLRYDEYFHCLDGRLRVREGERVLEAGPGDALWLPDGAEIVYEADAKTTHMFAVYPVDWQKRAGLA